MFRRVILLFLIILGLGGCIFNSDEGALMIVFEDTTGPTYDSVGYEVKQDHQNLAEDSVVAFTLENASSQELATSHYYWIEKYDDGHWIDVPFYEEFDDVELSSSLDVYEDNKRENLIPWEVGRYRIRREYSWNEINATTHDLMIEFEIQETSA